LRANLLRVLQVRLGQDLPAQVVQAVQGQSDVAVLDGWFDRSLTADTLEQVRTILGITGS
jgi:hypothetical protein